MLQYFADHPQKLKEKLARDKAKKKAAMTKTGDLLPDISTLLKRLDKRTNPYRKHFRDMPKTAAALPPIKTLMHRMLMRTDPVYATMQKTAGSIILGQKLNSMFGRLYR